MWNRIDNNFIYRTCIGDFNDLKILFLKKCVEQHWYELIILVGDVISWQHVGVNTLVLVCKNLIGNVKIYSFSLLPLYMKENTSAFL